MPRHVSSSELLLRQRLSALTRALPGAQKGDAAMLHHARVATRRLREALPLVLPAGSRARKLERKVRRLTRALGPVRELDVALLMLDELSASGDAPPAAISRLRQVLRQERQRLQPEMQREVVRVDVDKLRRRAAAAARKSGTAVAGKGLRDPARLADARDRAARRAVRLRDAMQNAAGIYLPDRLHAVRIAVKKLRYAMEVTRELSGSRAVTRIQTLKAAQDLLGRMHDLEVLIARVRAVQGSSKAPNLRLSGDLDQLVRRLETECRLRHGQYMTQRNALLAICDHAAAMPAGGRHAGAQVSAA